MHPRLELTICLLFEFRRNSLFFFDYFIGETGVGLRGVSFCKNIYFQFFVFLSSYRINENLLM